MGSGQLIRVKDTLQKTRLEIPASGLAPGLPRACPGLAPVVFRLLHYDCQREQRKSSAKAWEPPRRARWPYDNKHWNCDSMAGRRGKEWFPKPVSVVQQFQHCFPEGVAYQEVAFGVAEPMVSVAAIGAEFGRPGEGVSHYKLRLSDLF